jgi:hypothetical protein
MTRIERRQTRIRRISEQYRKAGKAMQEDVSNKPDVHHNIGKSQNFPESIPLFLQKHAGDPAVKVLAHARDQEKLSRAYSLPGLHSETERSFTSSNQSPLV